jgi:LytS/YehU family sensor histidine kinase
LFGQQAISLHRARVKRAAAEHRTARLELELLKRQIQPHFLMNALTAVSEWIETDPRTSLRMIDALANEFRALVSMSGQALVPLAEELALCRYHLEVMSYRNQSSFALVSDGVDTQRKVPPAIFHTLLENAITHNSYLGHTVFTLETSFIGKRTAYRLRSPLAGERGRRSGDGRGHSYVRARLEEAFGDDWLFSAGIVGDEWIDTLEMPAT